MLTIINTIIKGDGKIKPKYYDYTKEWFDDIGAKITVTMLVYTLVPHAI